MPRPSSLGAGSSAPLGPFSRSELPAGCAPGRSHPRRLQDRRVADFRTHGDLKDEGVNHTCSRAGGTTYAGHVAPWSVLYICPRCRLMLPPSTASAHFCTFLRSTSHKTVLVPRALFFAPCSEPRDPPHRPPQPPAHPIGDSIVLACALFSSILILYCSSASRAAGPYSAMRASSSWAFQSSSAELFPSVCARGLSLTMASDGLLEPLVGFARPPLLEPLHSAYYLVLAATCALSALVVGGVPEDGRALRTPCRPRRGAAVLLLALRRYGGAQGEEVARLRLAQLRVRRRRRGYVCLYLLLLRCNLGARSLLAHARARHVPHPPRPNGCPSCSSDAVAARALTQRVRPPCYFSLAAACAPSELVVRVGYVETGEQPLEAIACVLGEAMTPPPPSSGEAWFAGVGGAAAREEVADQHGGEYGGDVMGRPSSTHLQVPRTSEYPDIHASSVSDKHDTQITPRRRCSGSAYAPEGYDQPLDPGGPRRRGCTFPSPEVRSADADMDVDKDG